MNGLTYVDQLAKPLCPQYADPRHLVVVKIVNAMYDVMDRDADGEFVSPDQAKVYEAAQKAGDAYMNLYRITSSLNPGGRAGNSLPMNGYVESWYFRCPTCEFTMPAVGVRPGK